MILEQNTIAIIWDFDKTLIDGYMQDPIFKKYHIDSKKFWEEVNSLPAKYQEKGIRVNKETIYLNHMITCTLQGIFPELTNQLLFDLGSELNFYPGVPKIFHDLKESIQTNIKYQKYGIHVEHYIVSTGLTQMIKGSAISKYVDGIWGCEFIEDPILSELSEKRLDKKAVIQQPGYIIDNTSKTRAIFEINKGVNKYEYVEVNSKMESKDRRVPFENMIYIADGPSDVPVFSILQRAGGKTFAIYPKGNVEAMEQVDNLRRDGRIDMYAEANYTKDSTTYLWLTNQTKKIADKIYEQHEDEIKKAVKAPPTHLT
jgi:hypothetical protein